MPLYDFRCRECGTPFEAQVGVSGSAGCPACGTPDAERVYSGFAGPFTVRPRGLAARRSDAARADREEQRLERREQRRAAQAKEPPPEPRADRSSPG